MSHFAKVQRVGIGSTSLGVVREVIVADQAFVDHLTTNFPEDNMFYVQTSYNTLAGEHKLGGTPLRKNYATPTMIYDPVRDRQNKIDKGMEMITGRCTLGYNC